MKWYNGVMFILTATCVGIVILALTGCANTQMVEDAKSDTEYRKALENYGESKYEPKGTGPIEMPQEWMDQWPSLREEKVNE